MADKKDQIVLRRREGREELFDLFRRATEKIRREKSAASKRR